MFNVRSIDVRIDDSVTHWINGMKAVYHGNLAQNYTLHINGKDYPCNEAIMHAVLPDIPPEEWGERFSTVSTLGGNTDLISQILQYFYTCEIHVSMDTLNLILKASRVLNLSHLKDACEHYLCKHLSPEIYCSWLKFSEEENFETISKMCKDGIFNELDRVRQCQDFQRLSFAEVKELVEEHVKLGQSADKLFCAILSWIEKNDGQYYEELFNLIDMFKCSKQALNMATEEPYEKLLWTASFQNKLFRACLRAESMNNESAVSTSAGHQSCDREDTDDGHSEQYLNFAFPSVKKFALDMIQAFQDFQNNAKHTDIIIKLFDKDIQAHQVVLAAGAPYFEALLRSHASQDQNTGTMEADLTTMNPVIVPVLVNYMYSKSIHIEDLALLEHIYACDFLQIETLLSKCKEYAERGVQIGPSNCIDWIVGHRTFNLPQTKKNAMRVIWTNLRTVIMLNKLQQLESTELLELLNAQTWQFEYNTVSERDLLEALIAWINCDQESRKQCVTQLLESRAMTHCSVCWDLDMKHVLDSGSFGLSERDQFWQTHCKKMTKVRLM